MEKPPVKVGDPLLQPELGWKRIDDTDSNLQYEGPWKTDLQSIYYNGTVHYGIDEGLKCSFKFKGTTFRFIGIRKSYYRNKAIIKIDGTEYDLAQVYPQPPVGSEQRFQTLVFEKLDLQNTVHSVELYGNDIMIDAFDIDADGSIEKLPAKVGDQLLQPESGWKRIDDTDASFKYVGNSWKSGITAGDEWFNSTFHYIDGGSGEVAFRFSGTKLRIIGCLQEPQYRSNDIKIIIDGNQEMYSEQSDKIRYQTLVYEKLGLAEGVHDVVIKSGTTSQFPLTLDAIDIDEKGSISKPTVKVGDQLRQPEPGWKRIDDTDLNIQYGGVWATESKSTHYNSTLHYKHDSSNPTDTNPSTIKFDFEGTKLRIIGLVATSSYDTNATIIIDGKSEVINFRGDTLKTQTLVYEKLNLPSGVHSVEIQGIYLNLDAIDIDSEGSIKKPNVKVGDILLQPELGWTRVDDANPLISYKGESWNLGTGDGASNYYNKTNNFRTVESPGSLQFFFKGTGIRIVSTLYNNVSAWTDVSVEIDGVAVGKYAQADGNLSAATYVALLFEKTGLNDGVHKIKLSGTKMNMDAFDILGGDIVKPPIQVGDELKQPEDGWKRIDDTDSNIKYSGNWQIASNGDSYYNSTMHFKNSVQGPEVVSAEFTFTGTKLRVISSIQAAYDKPVTVTIDGVQESYSLYKTTTQFQTLVYEKLNLPSGTHKVKIEGVTVMVDALDIDSDGYMEKTPVKVGDELKQPETGWKRIDDTDANIKYLGNWKTTKESNNYNSTIHYNITSGVQVSYQFEFSGSKLRIIGFGDTGYDKSASITIDGITEDIVYYQSKSGSQIIVYEKLNLKPGTHTVKVEGSIISLDAIDIEDTGSMVKPPVKVGEILLQPEFGWDRLNNSDPSITYTKFIRDTDDNGIRKCFMNDYHYASNEGTVNLEFTGTGFRVLGIVYRGYSSNISIEIDGVKATFSEDYPIVGEYLQGSTLVYEMINLENKKHTVKIYNSDITKGLGFDAFDIKSGDTVKSPAKVGDILLEPEPGWKRIDDTDSNIKYTGPWQGTGSTSSGYYNNTMRYKNASSGSGPVSCEFTFTGTNIRVISAIMNSSQYYKGPVTITIDGIAETYTMNDPNRNDRQVLLYEKLNLSPGNHVVKIEAQENLIDAFDIDANGSIGKPPVTVGDELLQPEEGWQRIDDNDTNIKYAGNWQLFSDNSNYYNGTNHFKNSSHGTEVATAEFEFIGTKLRLISSIQAAYDKEVTITIDGFTEKFSLYKSTTQLQTLVYEKLNLPSGTHKVKIEGVTVMLDAIDINANGSMVKPTIKVGDELKQPESGWKRIDDTDPSFKYQGKWENGAHTSHYNNSWHYVPATESNGLIEFNFYGTQLRIISLLDVDVANDMSITIDGVTEQYSGESSVRIYQGLAYEKLGLTKELHTVRIQCGTKSVFYRLFLDAIDIDSDGYIEKPPVKVGDQLSQPEAGWKRLDNTEPNFKYRGTWYQGASAQWYNSTYHYVKDNDSLGAVEFDFYGTQLRIISCFDVSAYRSDDVSITIDGVTEKYSEIASANIGQVLAYEKLGLTKGKHRVRIQCGTKGTYRLNFDAIDIDLDGYIEWPPYKIDDIVTSPEPGWKRFDDNTSEILYDANWDKNVAYPGAYGGKSTRAHKGKNSSFRFKFKGTKFRLIVGCSTTEFYSDKISVRIDDLPLEFFDANAPADTNQVLKYEKLGLEDKEHEVKVKVETSRPGALSYDYRFDALDIDDTGSLIKINTIGNVLTEPEKGWKRIDDNDPLIRYIGNWKLTTGNDKHYNKTTHYNLDKKLDTSFEFEFVGTKLRLLAYGDSGYDATSKVLIDGKEETMVYNSPSGNQVIRYEKIGLDRGKHTVKVIGKAMSLDSIDIDADGYLLARLGDKLVEPEPGWVRFDDTHKNIEYNGFWKTTEGDVSCYNNTHHWKSKEDNNDSTISARFLFKGTKFRLISMTSPSYPEDIELKIDDQKEILKLSGEVMQYQTFAYEKKNLEDMIHVIELSGKYISIDAIDLEEGATLLKLPDEKLKPYQIRNGLIFKDDFDTFDSRWIASPVGSYSLIDRKGNFRMLHNVSRDTLLLADLPNEKEFAFEVSADYTPTHEDDKGGIIVWKNGEENIEFLETEDGTRETTELKWMACKDNEDWTFFSDYGEGFNFYDSDRMNCSKFGVVLKKGSNSKFVNLDIDSIIATRGRKLTIANIAPNISVQMEDEFGGIIFNGNTGYNTGIQITLPSLEFTGKVILTNVEGKELGVIKTKFYGGDVYGFGSNLEIKFSGEELSTLAQTRLPDMISGKSEIMLELVNPSVARANNVNLSIAQYEDKFGWSWADLALDSNGKPGQYQDSIKIPYVDPENTMKFWLKVTKGTDYVGLAPLQFQIHLEHE
ncbi:hypothetical protein COF67_25235 [Bacillus toyonensis]|nr:hypothetical protein COF67_25235 [Bacillus toyonensis]